MLHCVNLCAHQNNPCREYCGKDWIICFSKL